MRRGSSLPHPWAPGRLVPPPLSFDSRPVRRGLPGFAGSCRCGPPVADGVGPEPGGDGIERGGEARILRIGRIEQAWRGFVPIDQAVEGHAGAAVGAVGLEELAQKRVGGAHDGRGSRRRRRQRGGLGARVAAALGEPSRLNEDGDPRGGQPGLANALRRVRRERGDGVGEHVAVAHGRAERPRDHLALRRLRPVLEPDAVLAPQLPRRAQAGNAQLLAQPTVGPVGEIEHAAGFRGSLGDAVGELDQGLGLRDADADRHADPLPHPVLDLAAEGIGVLGEAREIEKTLIY